MGEKKVKSGAKRKRDGNLQIVDLIDIVVALEAREQLNLLMVGLQSR